MLQLNKPSCVCTRSHTHTAWHMFMEDIQVCVLGISTMVSTQISFSLINQANKTKHFIAVARLGALSPSLRPSYSYMTYRKCSGNTPPPNHIWYWKRKNGLPCLDSIPPFKSQTLTEGIRLPDLSSVARSSVRRLYIKRGKSCHVARKSPFIRQYWTFQVIKCPAYQHSVNI